MSKADLSKKSALQFVILMGIGSLFADMTYEGARSITGPYLASLGANAAIVGFVAGLGEFLGYGLRLLSGFIIDRSKQYWPIAFLGYFINLISIPLLAIVSTLSAAGSLIIAERVGKGLRVPARDAMLSHAAQRMGMGWGFGLHEALDKTGAMFGPFLVAWMLYSSHSYQYAFALLTIPAIMCLIMLGVARNRYPNPILLENQEKPLLPFELRTNKPFWFYVTGAGLVAFGYTDFALIAYHLQKTQHISSVGIPVIYSCALGANIIAMPLLGHWFDRAGINVVILATIVAASFVPLVFYGGTMAIIIGTVLWAIGVGAQGSLMRALVANMIAKQKRAIAYGVFNAVFGVAWLLGSILLGILYDISIKYLVICSICAQLAAIPFFWQTKRLLAQNQCN